MRKLHIHNEGLDILVKNTNASARSDDLVTQEQMIQVLKQVARFPSIQSIAITPKGVLRVTTNNLYIRTTDCERERTWDIGRWRMHIKSWDGEVVFRTRDRERLGYHSGVWRGYTVHPHIDMFGAACYGSASQSVPVYFQRGALGVGILMALEYLRSVNVNDAAGVYLGYLPEVDSATHEHCSDNEFTKNGVIARTIHGTVDRLKLEYYVQGYHTTCAYCGAIHNTPHMTQDPETGRYYCIECYENRVHCDICSIQTNKEELVAVDGKNICAACAESLYHNCYLCDAHIPVGKRVITYDSARGKGAVREICPTCREALTQVDTTTAILPTLTPVKVQKTLLEPYTARANEIAYYWASEAYRVNQPHLSINILLEHRASRNPHNSSNGTHLLGAGKHKEHLFALLNEQYVIYYIKVDEGTTIATRITASNIEECRDTSWNTHNIQCFPRVLLGNSVPDTIKYASGDFN